MTKCPICGEALENSESDCCAAVNAGAWNWTDEQEATVEEVAVKEEVVEEAPAEEPEEEKPAKKPKKKTTPKKKATKKA